MHIIHIHVVYVLHNTVPVRYGIESTGEVLAAISPLGDVGGFTVQDKFHARNKLRILLCVTNTATVPHSQVTQSCSTTASSCHPCRCDQ